MKWWQIMILARKLKPINLNCLASRQQELTSGMMNLDEMDQFIDNNKNDVLFKLNKIKRHPSYLKDEELRFIDKLLDDTIINRLLSYDGFTPSMRDIFPSNFLRAELLKSIKYPEVSYRKFCGDDKGYKGHKDVNSYIGLEKQAKSCIYRFTSQQKDNDKPCSDEPIQGKLIF